MKKKNLVLLLALGLVLSIFMYPRVTNAKKLEVKDMVRKNEANGVMFDIALVNPFLDQPTDEIVFKVWLTTHSGNLIEEIKSEKLAVKINNSGDESKVLNYKIEWIWDRKSSHHPIAYITLKKTDEDGNSLVTDATESIQLIVKNVRDVPSREFTWNEDVALQSVIVD
ncbi:MULTISPECIES: hypothetical protein [unclassified Candidatus Frackibacter]|uniref:hypothetical protein n=1 Tax=unclassified Candidatus Frackibacter TaxID=2648818 RepID=UPI00088CF99D|nr:MULTISPECIES: hypothetical protein [unclassified Candidatus Frackibacter]SDC33438.1 hypothetical protein SAMN04515661_10716 [Candidatus Frackibacter sp. WG11]SEM57701.1 hypothetical protein SAMN04488698_107101 [Candidatus Frackibacter sp. WG12]SFM09420.1 hypothetical protein SAMN04488699_1367 [Candidatus Frackibacter sp. WG13]